MGQPSRVWGWYNDQQRKHRTETPNQNIDGNTPKPQRGIYTSDKDRTNNGRGGNNQKNLQKIKRSLEQ